MTPITATGTLTVASDGVTVNAVSLITVMDSYVMLVSLTRAANVH